MGANAVADLMAEKYGRSKDELLMQVVDIYAVGGATAPGIDVSQKDDLTDYPENFVSNNK